jgi:type IV pilus assembly protein PilA
MVRTLDYPIPGRCAEGLQRRQRGADIYPERASSGRAFHTERREHGMRKLLKRDEGFTLIELMVVVLIIGILVAIALPTFLGARNRANDKAAQSGLRNALAAAKTCFTDNDSYAGCDDDAVTGLPTIETSLDFVDEATTSGDPGTISVFDDVNGDGNQWAGAAYSKSGTCFYIYDDVETGGQGTTYDSAASDGTDCLAQDAGVGNPSW